MTSKTKKILALGLSLSLSLMMPASLSRRACAEQGSEADTGCSRALVDNDPCERANTKCARACYDALNGKVDTTPAFCGENKVGEEPSYFLGCNEKFQKCMDKDCKFSYIKRTTPPSQIKPNDVEDDASLDTGCSRPLVDEDPCERAEIECSLACYDALEGKVDTTPAFCGEHKIGEEPSYFLGCNEEFQKCMDKDCRFLNDAVNLKAEDIMNKPLSFWERWRTSGRFLDEKYKVSYFGAVVVGACVVNLLGGMLAGIPGIILATPLAIAYGLLLVVF